MTLMGWGTPKDGAKGVQWLEGATRLGHLLASYDLAGLLLARGDNCERAVKLLKNVAEWGWGSLSEATADFAAGDYSWALYNYLRAADAGVDGVDESGVGWGRRVRCMLWEVRCVSA